MQNQITQTSIIFSEYSRDPSKKINSNNLLISTIEKGEQTRFRFEVLVNYDYSLLTFSLFNIALSLIFYQADYKNKVLISRYCLFFLEGITVIQILVTIFRYKAKIMLEKSQKILSQEQGIKSSGKIYQIGMEILVLFIKPYIFFENIKIKTLNIYDGFEFDYSFNYILVVLGLVKLFIALRVILMRQAYMSPRCKFFFIVAHRLCRMYGSQPSYLYGIKCLFKDSPFSLISVVFTASIIIFSISLRIAQRNLAIQYPKVYQGKPYPGNIEDFQNAVWLTIITMTTVGYGDLFPRTLFGRAINVFLIIWGSFIVSLMVVVLTNSLNMDQAQKRALIVLNRLEAKKQLKEAAAYLITFSCRKYLTMKKIAGKKRPPFTENQSLSLQTTFFKYSSNFQNIHRTIRTMYEIDDVYEQMTRQFEVINDQVSQMIANQHTTITKFRLRCKEETKKYINGSNDSKY